MTKKECFIAFLVAIVNTLAIKIIPGYFSAYLIVLLIGTAMFGAIIVMDILGKTHYWMSALYILFLGILSLIAGWYFEGSF